MKDLQYYRAAFKKLRTDKNRNKYLPETLWKAPHKPLLLLAVIDLIEMNPGRDNIFTFDLDLKYWFNRYWELTPYSFNKTPNIYLPFFHLKSEGFWHLVANEGQELFLDARSEIPGQAKLNELVKYATLDSELFGLLLEPDARFELRAALIESAFTPQLQAAVHLRVTENQQVAGYEKILRKSTLRGTVPLMYPLPVEQQPPLAVRDSSFRKVVVQAYEHTCAFCGTRIITNDGHTVVEAAHIEPWNNTRNDDPRNGMALCRLCHWGFDEGLLGVSDSLTILQSTLLNHRDNNPPPIMLLENKEINKPSNPLFWPLERYLKAHREAVFKN